jgi:hypothetical protein
LMRVTASWYSWSLRFVERERVVAGGEEAIVGNVGKEHASSPCLLCDT